MKFGLHWHEIGNSFPCCFNLLFVNEIRVYVLDFVSRLTYCPFLCHKKPLLLSYVNIVKFLSLFNGYRKTKSAEFQGMQGGCFLFPLKRR